MGPLCLFLQHCSRVESVGYFKRKKNYNKTILTEISSFISYEILNTFVSAALQQITAPKITVKFCINCRIKLPQFYISNFFSNTIKFKIKTRKIAKKFKSLVLFHLPTWSVIDFKANEKRLEIARAYATTNSSLELDTRVLAYARQLDSRCSRVRAKPVYFVGVQYTVYATKTVQCERGLGIRKMTIFYHQYSSR